MLIPLVFSSPSGKKVDEKGKRPLERRSTKRRYNEEHSDAEIIDWDSDDETEINHKAISKLMMLFDDDDDGGLLL